MTAQGAPDINVFNELDKLIQALEQRQALGTAPKGGLIDDIVKGLREGRAGLEALLPESEAAARAEVERQLAAMADASREPASAAALAPEPERAPLIDPPPSAMDDGLGERLRDQFLQFLGDAPPPSPNFAGRASLNFADWAMGTSGIIEPTSGSAESWVLGGLLTETGDRRAIWIGRLAIAELTQRAKLTLNGVELAALEAATQWVLTPTDAQKSAAATAFANIKDDAAIRGLGRAIAAAQPESALTNEAVAAGVLDAIHRCSMALTVDDERASYRRQVLHIARTVFNGTALWDGSHVAEKPTAQNFDSWFMTSRGSN